MAASPSASFNLPQTCATDTRTYCAEPVESANWTPVRHEHHNGKPKKIPIDPHTGRRASSTDPASWGTYQEAAAYARRTGSGIGFMLTPNDPYTLIDVDSCRDPDTGELTADARLLVDRLQTYTEVSTSGTGLHLIARARKPGPRCRRTDLGIEIYDRARLVVFTGQHIAGTPRDAQNRQDEVDRKSVV